MKLALYLPECQDFKGGGPTVSACGSLRGSSPSFHTQLQRRLLFLAAKNYRREIGSCGGEKRGIKEAFFKTERREGNITQRFF